MRGDTPTIRGAFVRGHVERLREQRGDTAVAELERRWGKPLRFGTLAEVPVADEAALLELIVDIQDPATRTPGERARAAGRLHFENFASTGYGGTLVGALPKTPQGLCSLLLNAGTIVRFVFKRLDMSAEQLPRGLCVTMRGSTYPPEHFKGFFEAMMGAWGLGEQVALNVPSAGVHEYRLTFAQSA